MDVSPIQIKIGEYELHPVPTGEFALDGGAMFGTVPKILWEKSNPADDKNRIRMEARGLLLKGKKNILIDCGNGSDFVDKYGEKLGNKFAELYKIEVGGSSLKQSLQKQDLTPESIDIVILTHLHFDHAGGGVTSKNGKLVPTFPNAKYYVQKKNVEIALKPNLREKASYYASNVQPLIDTGVLVQLDGPSEIAPGITTWISNGHTQAHQMVHITDGKTTVIYCGDVVPTSSHVRLPWVMGYDLNPLMLIEEKTKYLGQAAKENAYLFFEHDPYCDLASIKEMNGDFAVQQRYTLS
ncbi:MAG: MBL fold metallo-hydrolase [Bdellovibrio sp. 28-41-41]|nr:MAG: MBL fold metallo-hydrolase [Bdellovibrio sp. 28-41-41]